MQSLSSLHLMVLFCHQRSMLMSTHPRGGENHVAIALIVQLLRSKLGQHDLCKIYPNAYVIQSTFQIRGMHTLIRDREISKHDFVFYSDQLIRLVVEHGLGHLPFTEKQVITPTASVYTRIDFAKSCVVFPLFEVVKAWKTPYVHVAKD
ncbi:hypothetical protein Goshw_018034 [Gossypium schwendimanii]|uniref:Phosphoribosyltransferase domain-containing protein n=1 Tax=Gossypium schwendimanii TaxID=34291 RepID=A0A7J9MIF7_GOSSC|nr:hypothetical protein [Gossypium schwendimanii]